MWCGMMRAVGGQVPAPNAANQKARLACSDFTNWVGESIHRREGFYFRHDSMKNPVFDQALQKREYEMKENNLSAK